MRGSCGNWDTWLLLVCVRLFGIVRESLGPCKRPPRACAKLAWLHPSSPCPRPCAGGPAAPKLSKQSYPHTSLALQHVHVWSVCAVRHFTDVPHSSGTHATPPNSHDSNLSSLRPEYQQACKGAATVSQSRTLRLAGTWLVSAHVLPGGSRTLHAAVTQSAPRETPATPRSTSSQASGAPWRGGGGVSRTRGRIRAI